MNITEIKEIAKQHNLKVGKSTKGELIRSIQQAEGNFPCFGSNSSGECDQTSCLWRDDCN